MVETVKRTIKEVCDELHKDGIGMEDIGKLIGVSRLQVHNYIKEVTVNPKPLVCMKIYDNVTIEDKKVLVGPYVDVEHLKNTVEMINKARS